METKLIKTCYGLKEIRFHEGAVVPPDLGLADLLEARKSEAEMSISARADQILWCEMPAEMIADLNRMTYQAFQRSEAERVAAVLSAQSKTSRTAQAVEQVSEEMHRKIQRSWLRPWWKPKPARQ